MADRSIRSWRGFGWATAALAIWGAIAPYAGPYLGFMVQTRPIVEIIDHVVPAVVLLGVATVAIRTRGLPLPAALIATLAGMWMTGTHAPLLLQAARNEVAIGAALWHSLPGMVLFLVQVAASVLLATERPRAHRPD